MKNKGFTLIELIITIALMAMIGVVIASNMSGMFSKEEDKSIDNFKKQLQDAACVLSESNSFKSRCQSGCTITMNDLITNGLIDENLKDPRNNKRVKETTYTVKVQYNNKVKTCTFTE